MDIEIEKTLTLVAERAKLAEGVEGVRSVLLYMYRFPALKNKILAQKTGIAVPTLAAVRSELVKSDILKKRNRLGEKGRNWVKKNLNLFFDYDPLPDNIDGGFDEIPDEFSYLRKCESFLKKRPTANYSYDQAHADFTTTIKRTLHLIKRGEIEGRKLIFLGDDDATSILVGLTSLSEEITVLDIDQRILDFLKTGAKEFSIRNMNFICHDLRESCPENILNKYDVVVMDPPYTVEALRLFLKRAKQILRTNVKINNEVHPVIGKKCVLYFGNKPPGENQKAQLSILDHGFVIKELIPDFNHYIGASILGQFSHLYYLQLANVLKTEQEINLKTFPIYTSEVKSKNSIPYRPIGYHFTGEMRFNEQKLLLENEKIQKIFLDSLKFSELTLIDLYNHNYQPYGFSAVAILKTSHAAIHTWPEHGYISIDIFICDEYPKGLRFLKILKNELNPQKSEFFYIERGKDLVKKYEPIELK